MEKVEVAADNRGAGRPAWHLGEMRGGGSHLRWAGNPKRWQLLTTLTHNRHLVRGARLGIG